MDRFLVHGPCRLEGTVAASGAKNAALPALAATLLASEPVVLHRIPRVRDIATMRELLSRLGVTSTEREDGALVFEPGSVDDPHEAVYDLVKKMRASVLALGPLVGRRGRAKVSLPGGCAIGVRPIDQHLKALDVLGAQIRLEHGYVLSETEHLVGTRFRFEVPTVTGTENVMMAAVLAEGETILDNCAREPEIVDLANLLRGMGAKIEGDGEERMVIEGVDELGGAEHEIIADRIEGGTYLVGAVLTGGDVTLLRCDPAAVRPLLDKLEEAGATVEVEDCSIRVARSGSLRAVDVATEPHPGFPTDLQAQFVALMTQAEGTATIEETIFENRFQHVAELGRMGARIDIDGRIARVHGPTRLTGATVMATDLRASACLVIAGLAAHGDTTVDRIYHLDRGYEGMENKLKTLGATVERVPGPPSP